MINKNKLLSIKYSNTELRNLIEEFLIQQKTIFTFTDLSSYIAYWAMEDGMASNNGNTLYESNKLQAKDQKRLLRALDAIVRDGRIKVVGELYHKLQA